VRNHKSFYWNSKSVTTGKPIVGSALIVMLGGGDKSSQSTDIA